MSTTITDQNSLILRIMDKDDLLKQWGLNYTQRSHIHTQAMWYLIDKHPELRQFIMKAYAESGLCDARQIVRELAHAK
jgi:hypothetical protein